MVAIRAAHGKTRRTYGAKRLHKELQEEGFVIGRDRVERLRREMGINCKQRRHFKITTQSDHDSPVAPNLLAPHFVAQKPDAVWHVDESGPFSGVQPLRLLQRRSRHRGTHPLTASLRTFPALNDGLFRAEMLIVAPVDGLRPRRAGRSDTENVPKPTRLTLSSAAMAFVTG